MINDPYLMTELVRARQADCLALASRPATRGPGPLESTRLVAGEMLIQLGQWVRGCVVASAPAPVKRPELT